MKFVNEMEAEKDFDLWLEECNKEIIVIRKNNKNAAVLINYGKYIFLENLKNKVVKFSDE
jgi:PHD/YefM family antitoxin component YafN of YafNO toxin-antitoxin module